MAVLGAGGRLGRLLRPLWAEAAFQSRDPRMASPGGCLDPLADPAGLARFVRGAHTVIVLSGVTNGAPEALARNTDLALAGLEAAARGGAQRVLIASSAAVYGGGGPFGEDAPLAPAGVYGAAKAAMEDAVLRARAAMSHGNGPEVAILRIANVAGADWLLGRARGPVPLHRCAGGRGPRRSFIGPDALARAITALAFGPTPPSFLNISAPGTVALGDLARAAGLTVIWRDGPPDAPERVEIDAARLWSFLGLAPPPADPAALVAGWRALAGTAVP